MVGNRTIKFRTNYVINKIILLFQLLKMNQSSVNWHNMSNCNDGHVQLLLVAIQGQQDLTEQEIVELVEATPTAVNVAAPRRKRVSSHLVHVLR